MLSWLFFWGPLFSSPFSVGVAMATNQSVTRELLEAHQREHGEFTVEKLGSHHRCHRWCFFLGEASKNGPTLQISEFFEFTQTFFWMQQKSGLEPGIPKLFQSKGQEDWRSMISWGSSETSQTGEHPTGLQVFGFGPNCRRVGGTIPIFSWLCPDLSVT